MHDKLKAIAPLKPWSNVARYAGITFGIFLMTFAFYYFLVPINLVLGGVSGLGIILQAFFDGPIALTIYVLNGLLLILGLVFLGKKVFIRSLYGSIAFPTFVLVYEWFERPFELDDFFLASVFGGVLMGLGFGYVIRYGGTSGGTDIPIKILHKLLKIKLSWSIYIVDGMIILLGLIVFIQTDGIEYGLYALLGVFLAGQSADRVVVGASTLKAVHIISDHNETIKQNILDSIERGVSVVPIEGGFTKQPKTMLVTVITRNEYYRVREIVALADPSAFVFASPATEIHGDFVLKSEEDE